MEKFYLQTEIEVQYFANSFNCTLRIQGPLYNGVRHSLCKLQLDFSFREKIILEPKIITLGRLLKELPPFDAVVMAEEEILAEKVRTIITRTKARDVYDLWFLLQRNVQVDFNLVEKKLQYYKIEYSLREFSKHLHLKKEIWESELTPLLLNVPSFAEVKKLILAKMGKQPGKGRATAK